MAGFGAAPTVVKVAFFCIIIGFVLNVIGFASPYWTSYLGGNSGLWQYCSDLTDDCYRHKIIADWFESVRTFEAIGFIATIVTLVFAILYIFVGKTAGNKIVAILSSIISLGTAGVIFLGIFIYLGKVDNLDVISWALGLSAGGAVLFGLAGILLVVSICAK